jgi:hypothetical protein
MSGFVLVLAAEIAVSSGREAVSVEAERGLGLHGDCHWAGPLLDARGDPHLAVLVFGRDLLFAGGCGVADPFVCCDTGRGTARIAWGSATVLGIYRHDGDRLFLCFRKASQGRPVTFEGGKGQYLFTLRRFESSK